MSFDSNIRLIGRLDIKGQNLIKGVHLEGLRVIGEPSKFATSYYNEGIDELIFMDSVASLYGRNQLYDIIEQAIKNVFVPLTVGGGIRTIDDVSSILRSGADKIAVNTAAVKDPQLISKIANKFGSQCMVLSIEAKKINSKQWEVYTDNGREKTGLNVIEWIKESVNKGAGEILLTSIDHEGTRRGFDIELIKAVSEVVNVPIIVSGGMGVPEDAVKAVQEGKADAIAMADILHYNRFSIANIREVCKKNNLNVRNYE